MTVDTTAPTGGTPDLLAGSHSGSSTTDNLTNVTSPTFTVALNSTVAAGDTVQLLLGGSALAHNVLHTITAADVTAGSVSLAVTAGDLGADGAKSIGAKFTDAAGNSSTTSALSVTLDTTGPAAPTVALTNDTGSFGYDHITSNGLLTVTPAEAGGTIQYSTNGGTTGPARLRRLRAPTTLRFARSTRPAITVCDVVQLHPRYHGAERDDQLDDRHRHRLDHHDLERRADQGQYAGAVRHGERRQWRDVGACV